MRSEHHHSSLLPAGITDELPPQASVEVAAIEQVMRILEAYGYERVKPPLVEFEGSLVTGLGKAVIDQTFRLMDPVSQKMMGLRADITPQIARIAATRLTGAPRPLRLSYAGQVVRVKGSQLRPERQFTQVGAELIGVTSATADAETICLAASSLKTLGIENISIDLGMPSLISSVCGAFIRDKPQFSELRQALNRKDAAAIQDMSEELGKETAQVLVALTMVAGDIESSLSKLMAIELNDDAAMHRDTLADVIDTVLNRDPDISLTIDPVENRGFEYHTGVTYTLFACGIRGELGRGGRYQALVEGSVTEPSTGFSLFMDTVLRSLKKGEQKPRLFMPFDLPVINATQHRINGWIVIESLEPVADNVTEARRLNCSHIASNHGIKDLNKINGDQEWLT